MIIRAVFTFTLMLLVSACGSMKPIPADTFYRLEKMTDAAAAGVSPWPAKNIVIKRIRANGIYKDRALAMMKSDGVSLVQSKYHYWNESPEIMLQERLYQHVVAHKLAPHVSLEMTEEGAHVISGRLLRFEKVDTGTGAGAVAIELLLAVHSQDGEITHTFSQSYQFSEALQTPEMGEAVKSLSAGLDSLITQFLSQAGPAMKAKLTSLGANSET